MTKYDRLIKRKIEAFGESFHTEGISTKFIPYYNSGEKIKVKFSSGEIKTGTVGITTGWAPCFLLMLRTNSTGSSYLLSDCDEILHEGLTMKLRQEN